MALLLRSARAVLVLAMAAPSFPQAPDAAQAPPQVVHVRDASTGLPLPGVVVRVGARHDEPHLVDGWLRRFGRRPVVVDGRRSDPDGRVMLTAAEARQPFTVGPEFRLVEERHDGGERVLVVESDPHYAVHVVDSNGRAVADFALCMQGLGNAERTDALGLATFSSRDFRLLALRGATTATFAPVQWIGPGGSMP
jgi:hypothetical protein